MESTITCNQSRVGPSSEKEAVCCSELWLLGLLPVPLASIPLADHAMQGQAEPNPVGRTSTVTRPNVSCQGVSASGEMYKSKARVLN